MIINQRNQTVFIKEETTPGVLAFPTSSDMLELESQSTFNQKPNTTPLNRVSSSRTQTGVSFNYMSYGDFSGVSFYARPSGTAGTSPSAAEKLLLKSGLGSVYDGSTSGTSSLTVSSITRANPAVITTSAAHLLKVGDKIAVTGSAQSAFNTTYNVVSKTSTTVTTDVDASAFGSGAASDGTLNLKMSRFSLTTDLPTFSIWVLENTSSASTARATLRGIAGCQISSLETNVEKSGALILTITGKLGRIYFGGSALLSATAANSATTLSFTSGTYNVGELFFVGQKVNIVDPAGTAVLSAPVAVSAVNTGANTITVDALSVSNGPLPIGSIVTPYLPAGTTSGYVVENRTAQIFLGAADLPYGQASGTGMHSANWVNSRSISLKVSQNLLTPGEKDLNGSDFPSIGFIPDTREVSGEITMNFSESDIKYFESLRANPRRCLGIQLGTVAGKIIDFYLPKVFLEIPDVGNNEGAMTLTFKFTAEQPAAGPEEELVVVYR